MCNVLRIAQAKAAKSGAKADIIGKPLELYNRAQSFLDRGLTQAAGYLDSSFAGPYIERAAIYVEKAKCAAYEGCVNGIQKLIPGSNGTRIMQGGGLVLGGIFKGLGGVMLSAASATFSWTGIAVPGIGAGVVTASAGASDIYQGIEEISLGVKGDSETKTSNGLSDMLYGGNDGIYHASTGIAAISGSLLIPYVKTAYSKTPVVTGEGTAGQAGGAEGGLEPGTLSNVDARKWYLEQEAKIPDLIDDSLPLEQQARQAFELRNQYRMQARELMSDRQLAESLYATDPNLTWEQIIQKQIDKGLSGDDIYKAIIESSQRSRTSVNQSLGLE